MKDEKLAEIISRSTHDESWDVQYMAISIDFLQGEVERLSNTLNNVVDRLNQIQKMGPYEFPTFPKGAVIYDPNDPSAKAKFEAYEKNLIDKYHA